MDDDELNEDEDRTDPLVDFLDDTDLVLGTVEIVRYITTAGQDLLIYRATDPAGTDLPLTEVMGMLRLAEDSFIRDAWGEFPPAE